MNSYNCVMICSYFIIFGLVLTVSAAMDDKEIFAKTLYAEARGEPVEGQIWVAWVIKNRAFANKSYWGGSKIGDVCRKPKQFSCWNNKNDIVIHEKAVYKKIKQLTDLLYDAPATQDPTGGADHYHSTALKKYPSWTKNCKVLKIIGHHIFYKSLHL